MRFSCIEYHPVKPATEVTDNKLLTLSDRNVLPIFLERQHTAASAFVLRVLGAFLQSALPLSPHFHISYRLPISYSIVQTQPGSQIITLLLRPMSFY